MILVKTMLTTLMLAASLLADGECAPPTPGGGGVDVGIPVCQMDIKAGPHLEGDLRNRVVVATVHVHCDNPLPLSHHMSAWLDLGVGGGWVPIGNIERSNTVPDPAGFSLTPVAPCKYTNMTNKHAWRIMAKANGQGPASKAAPQGIPFKFELRDSETRHADLPCRGTP